MAKQGQIPTGMQSGLGELKSRLLFVLLAIVVYRIGAHIPVPGINPDRLAALFDQNQGTILSLFNMFSGGALERMSILALGIMPYISASIIMQLMTVVSPTLAQIEKTHPLKPNETHLYVPQNYETNFAGNNERLKRFQSK